MPLSGLSPLVSSLERKLRGGTVAWVWPILFEICLPHASLCPAPPEGPSGTLQSADPATSRSSPIITSLNCLGPSCKPDQEARAWQGELMAGRGGHCTLPCAIPGCPHCTLESVPLSDLGPYGTEHEAWAVGSLPQSLPGYERSFTSSPQMQCSLQAWVLEAD